MNRPLAVLLICVSMMPAAWAGDRVRIETSAGDIVLMLFPQQAPATVKNFLAHANAGFYEGLVFHRVIANFVIQTGGYDAAMNHREPLATVMNESANGLRNERGTVAMARLDDPDSADSQFFVNVRTNPHLDSMPGKPGYTVFARVVEGMEVVETIELTETTIRNGMAGVPVEPIVIRRVRVESDQ